MKLAPLFIILFTTNALAATVTLSTHDLWQMPESIVPKNSLIAHDNGFSRVELSEVQIGALAQYMHELRNRCGGFIVTPSGQKKMAKPVWPVNSLLPTALVRQPEVLNLMPMVREDRMLETIKWFSSYKTRYYLSRDGIQAMKDLADRWRSIVRDLPNAEVKLWKHSEWEQPSVVLKIKGTLPEEIVLGGHGDSINTDHPNEINAHSPGADDNASGISVLTEIIQVLADTKHTPQRTLTFIAYAAEEVGLRGSMDIATTYAQKDIAVKSVIQFDGTNYKGSQELGLVLYEDLTDPGVNQYLEKLINTYLQLPWAYDRCGYACSDHYPWTYNGYRSSFPFESRGREENPRIHTAGDTIEFMGENAHHSVTFARLGLAYVLEMDQ